MRTVLVSISSMIGLSPVTTEEVSLPPGCALDPIPSQPLRNLVSTSNIFSSVFNLSHSTHTFPVTKSNGLHSVCLSQEHSTVLPTSPLAAGTPAAGCPLTSLDTPLGSFANSASFPQLHHRPPPVLFLVFPQTISPTPSFNHHLHTDGSKMAKQ